MQPSQTWIEREVNSAFNTAVIASGSEQIVGGTNHVDHFNFLMVQNRDITPIQVRLDNMTSLGRVVEVQANGGLVIIDPANGDDINFKQIVAVNLDAANAETANKILFRWAFKERVS